MVQEGLPQSEVDKRIMQIVINLAESLATKIFWSLFELMRGSHARSLQWLGETCGVVDLATQHPAGAETLRWSDAVRHAIIHFFLCFMAVGSIITAGSRHI